MTGRRGCSGAAGFKDVRRRLGLCRGRGWSRSGRAGCPRPWLRSAPAAGDGDAGHSTAVYFSKFPPEIFFVAHISAVLREKQKREINGKLISTVEED